MYPKSRKIVYKASWRFVFLLQSCEWSFSTATTVSDTYPGIRLPNLGTGVTYRLLREGVRA
jgi:hypothetical protein